MEIEKSLKGDFVQADFIC